MRVIFLFLYIIISVCSLAQKPEIDSLKKLLSYAKDDTTTINLYFQLCSSYYINNDDSLSTIYAEKALSLAQKTKWSKGEAIAMYILATNKENNHAVALTVYLDGLKKFEIINDTVGIINSLFRINIIYKFAEEYNKSVEYCSTGLELSKRIGDSIWVWTFLYNIGNAYAYLNQADSALWYYQEAYRYANIMGSLRQRALPDDYINSRDEIIGWSYHGLGRAQQLLNNDDLALNYFLKGLSSAKKQSNIILANDLQLSISETFFRLNKPDSSIKYAQTCLEDAIKDNYVLNILGSYTNLAQTYEGRNNDSAVKYYKLAVQIRTLQFSAKNKTDLKTLTFNEETRQKELIAQRQKIRDERKRNLQFASIGVGLISFIVIALLLSTSIIVKSGLVRFLGIIALLLVFEFINLLIHPFIGELTHHSPILMFLIMVCIAALLVPAHHKIEHWITHQLVEKNKRIRLAAAKKTIQQLQG